MSSNKSLRARNFPDASYLSCWPNRLGWLTIFLIWFKMDKALLDSFVQSSGSYLVFASWDSLWKSLQRVSCMGVILQKQSWMILSGSSLRTSFLSLRRMKGMTFRCRASRTSLCCLLNSRSSSLKVVRFTLNSFWCLALKVSSVPRYPGIRNSKMPHNYNNLFWTGVPDRITLWSLESRARALNLLVLGFLTRCPSSRTMNLYLIFWNSVTFFSTRVQLVMTRLCLRVPFSNSLRLGSPLQRIQHGDMHPSPKYLLYSYLQCSTSVAGATTRLTCPFSLALKYSFSITVSVCRVFPKPMSSHRAPFRKYLTKNPSHLTPYNWYDLSSTFCLTSILYSKLLMFLKSRTKATPFCAMDSSLGEKLGLTTEMKAPINRLDKQFMAVSLRSPPPVMSLIPSRRKRLQTGLSLVTFSSRLFQRILRMGWLTPTRSQNHSKNWLDWGFHSWQKMLIIQDTMPKILSQCWLNLPRRSSFRQQSSLSRNSLLQMGTTWQMVPSSKFKQLWRCSGCSNPLKKQASNSPSHSGCSLPILETQFPTPCILSELTGASPFLLCRLVLLSWYLAATWLRVLVLNFTYTDLLLTLRTLERCSMQAVAMSLMKEQCSSLITSWMDLMMMLRGLGCQWGISRQQQQEARTFVCLISSFWISTMVQMEMIRMWSKGDCCWVYLWRRWECSLERCSQAWEPRFCLQRSISYSEARVLVYSSNFSLSCVSQISMTEVLTS